MSLYTKPEHTLRPTDVVVKRCIGVVLAGGQSSRMGRDKALLPYKGQSLLQHQVALLTQVCERVVVSGEYSGFECIDDMVMRYGPLAGIHAVASRFPDASLLVIAVDMPALSVPLLLQMQNIQCACHFIDQPLPAYFPDSNRVVAALDVLFNSPERGFSVRRLHKLLNSLSLPSGAQSFININTFEQWQAFNGTEHDVI